MLAPITHILALTNIRRTRLLDFPGQVLVRTGQKVSASDIIARAQVPSKHMILDIRRGLGIPKASEAESCIVRQQGERLEKGDVIAETNGLFSRIVRAPLDAEIVAIFGGQVLLRTGTTISEVQAGMLGTVVEIVSEFGAVIEVDGGLVQGVWGNGQADSGLLVMETQAPDDELTSQEVDVAMRGAIVVSGHCASADALRAGGDLPLRGLVLSSMSAELIPLASSLKYPILVIEGFGKFPYNQTAFELLKTSEKRDVSINAVCSQQRGERPELVIPLPATGQPAPETDYFAPGQTVRIQGAPYTGKTGTIVWVEEGLYSFLNGLKAPSAEVQIDNDVQVAVPLANLEVIE